MFDFYQLLEVKPKASQNKIFKAFKKQLKPLLTSGTPEEIREKAVVLFSAFYTLQEGPRKFYDLLLLKKGMNTSVQRKYTRAVEVAMERGASAADVVLSDSQQFKTHWQRNVLLAVLMEVGISVFFLDGGYRVSRAILLLIVGIITTVVGYSQSVSIAQSIGVSLAFIGVMLLRRAILIAQREYFLDTLARLRKKS